MSQISTWQARLADYLMKHDKRPPLEQVKSGFRITRKMLAALAVALVFYGGCAIIKNSQHPSGWILGIIIIALSTITMAATVRFWMAGFAGFIAFGAWRSLGGIFFAKANHLSTQYKAVFAVTIFAMAILCYRFTSKKFLLRPLDRASIVIARHMLAGILLSRE
jgi:hypothetical protein